MTILRRSALVAVLGGEGAKTKSANIQNSGAAASSLSKKFSIKLQLFIYSILLEILLWKCYINKYNYF